MVRPGTSFLAVLILGILMCLYAGGCADADPKSKPMPNAAGEAATDAPGEAATTSADETSAPKADARVAEVKVEETNQPPATVAEALKWLDLRTFPVLEDAKVASQRRQIGELHYDAPASLQEAFDFQRKSLEDLGWKLLPGGRLDGENPMADFTQHGFLVSTSVSSYSQTPGHVSVWLKNHGNVLPESLPVPEGVEAFYPMRSRASYVTTNDTEQTSDAVWKLLLDLGWQPYGQAGTSRYFKQNAILLTADVSAHPAQPGKTFITYATEQLSSDLPVPADVADPRYTDSMKRLHFDHVGEATDALAEFYNTELGKLGWKPTGKPVGDETVSVVYRNDAQEIITLDMHLYNDLTRVDVEHFTAEEIAAMKAEIDRTNELAEQKAAEEMEREQVRRATARINLPIPGEAQDVDQDDDRQVTFLVATGTAQEIMDAYKDHFSEEGWETKTSTVATSFGRSEYEKDDLSVLVEFMDTGITGDAEFEISSDDARLVLKRNIEAFAELGGQPAPPPISQDALVQAPADIAIPADALELKVRPKANVAYDVAASVERVAASFREAMERHGWTHHDSDIDEDSALVSFRKGRAPCSASMHQSSGRRARTSVTIAGGGMNWDKLRAADQPLDPAVGPDPAAPKPVEIADTEMLDEEPVESPAVATEGRLLAMEVAVPEAATDLQRDPDTEMIIFRSELLATKVAQFYREQLAKHGWSEIEDESFVEDDLGVGAVSFEKGDWGIRVAIQDGRPDSKSRVIVMGDGLQWGDGETPTEEPTGEEMPVAPQFVGTGKCQGKIFFGEKTFEMNHVLAALRVDDGTPVTRLYLCSEPFPSGALATIARKDASIFNLLPIDSPPCMELRIGDSYTSISCFVEGASINLGTDEIKSNVKRDENKLVGRVHLAEPHDFFDTPYRFDVQVDLELASAETYAGEASEGGLVLDEKYDLPVPADGSEVMQEGTPYRKSIQASIDADLSDVLSFYRAELEKQGWHEEVNATKQTETTAMLTFSGEKGPLELELTRRRGETMINVTLRLEELARQHGIVAEKGKAMLVLGNALEAAVNITVDGKVHKLSAEQGARDPAQALKLPIEPGEHVVIVPGAEAEKFTVPAGATWGAIAIPGGGAFIDRIY